MSDRGITGQALDVLIGGCYELRDTETYVCLEYCNKTYRSRTCKGGKNPVYQDQFTLILVEGVQEINVTVWAKNTFTEDEMIAVGKIHLTKVLHHGSDDSLWPLQYHSRKGGHIKHGGQIKLIMTYRGHQTTGVTHSAISVQPATTYSLPQAPSHACETYQISYAPPPPPPPPQTYQYVYTSVPPPPVQPYQPSYAPPPPQPPPAQPCLTFTHSSSFAQSPPPPYMYPNHRAYPSGYQEPPPPCHCAHCTGHRY